MSFNIVCSILVRNSIIVDEMLLLSRVYVQCLYVYLHRKTLFTDRIEIGSQLNTTHTHTHRERELAVRAIAIAVY